MRYIQKYIYFFLRNITSRPLSELVSLVAGRIKETADWMSGIPAIPFAVSRAKRASSRQSHEPKLVVFVCHTPRAREAKLAYGLRSAGWKVVLLYAKEPAFETTSYFDEVRRYRHAWQALLIACRYSSRVYHVFSHYADSLAAVFIKYKPGKIVFDVYDVWEAFKWNPTLAQGIERQHFCIENADALCCRDLKVKYIARRHNYKSPRRLIFFPDYCWDFEQGATPRQECDSREIHVVLAGSFGVEKRGFADAGYLDIAEKLAAQKIHFHIYPHSIAVHNKKFESDYVTLSNRTPFLHLHRSLPMDALIPELMKYDVGIAITRFLTYGEESRIYNHHLFRYCGSARIADYLDAGLPVITNREMKLMFYTVARYGVAIDGSLKFMENAREYLQRIISDEVKEKIRKSRSLYSIRRHIGRLIAFYESL